MNTRLSGLLLVLNALLLAVLVWLWVGPGASARRNWTAPASVKPDLAADADVAGRLGGSQAAQLTATLDRPLFDASRRPGVAAAPESPASGPLPAAARPEVQLLGVYTASGVTGVLARVDGKVRRIARGEAISGDWRLAEIGARHAVIRHGDERHVIKLNPAAGTAAGVLGPAGGKSFDDGSARAMDAPAPRLDVREPGGPMPPPLGRAVPAGAGSGAERPPTPSPFSSGGRPPAQTLMPAPGTPGPGSPPAAR